MAEKISQLPISNKQSRAFARLMLAGAWDLSLDQQGRVMIPEYLRKYARLEKHVIVAGLYKRVEIWNEDAWHEFSAKSEADTESIAVGLGELGL